MIEKTRRVCPRGYTLEIDWVICPYCGGQITEDNPTPCANLLKEESPVLAPTVREELKPSKPPPAKHRKTVLWQPPAPTKGSVSWLVGLNGPLRGHDFRIDSDHITIGAIGDADLQIDDEFASKHHCSIRYSDGVYSITDLDSTNGTFVNNEKIIKATIKDGDKIKIGQTEFIFKMVLLPEKD